MLRSASRLPGTPPRRQGWIFWTALAAISILAVFILPLLLPPSTPTFSASYAVGFNNRVAALAVILLSLTTAAVCSQRLTASSHPLPQARQRMPVQWLLLACLATMAYVGVLGWLDLQTDSFESDSAYFLTQLAQWSHFHLKLYRDLEFGYGPLLFAWPAAFQITLGHLRISPQAAYLVSLATLQLVGLGITFYILNRLSLPRSTRGWVLLALTIGAMRPSLGLNYTLFRFLTPLAVLLFVAERTGKLRQAALFAVAEPLMLSISPEIGIAFFAGVLFYVSYRACRERPLWLAVALLPLLSGLAFAASVDIGYFYTMRQFATGMLNLVVSPTPEILFLLIAAIALAPLAIAHAVRDNQPEAATLVGLYGASLALIPAALGLCDNLHLFFNGLGLYLLSFLALARYQARWSKLFLAALILMATPNQLQSIATAISLQPIRQAVREKELAEVQVWERETDGARIFAPAGVPLPMREKLMADDLLMPSRFSGLDNAFSPDAESTERQVMQSAAFVLVPQGDLPEPTPDERRRMRLLRLWHKYRIRNAAYIPLKALRAELLSRATAVGEPDPYSGLRLYRLR